jgi:hypothetical protein
VSRRLFPLTAAVALLSALLAVPSCLYDNYHATANRFLSELQDNLGLYWDRQDPPAISDDELPPGTKPWKKLKPTFPRWTARGLGSNTRSEGYPAEGVVATMIPPNVPPVSAPSQPEPAAQDVSPLLIPKIDPSGTPRMRGAEACRPRRRGGRAGARNACRIRPFQAG